jgi:predicted amidohydrolase YtcJ
VEGVDLIVRNAKVVTIDPARPAARAFAVRGDRFVAVGDEREIMPLAEASTRVIDAGGRTVIPGLNDSHTHVIRGGLHYNMELRWDGVPSLAEAMRMLRRQVERTPAPQWVRVIGAFSEFQFAERRLPTIAELNAAAPDTPVMILHLYDRTLLNAAALRALGYTKDTPDPPRAKLEREKDGTPTGVVLAKPAPRILLELIAAAPKLAPEDEANSTRQFMRELNRLGVTSVIDAGGGFQRYPEDYQIIEQLHRQNLLTVRIAYNVFNQRAGQELADMRAWMARAKPGDGDAFYRLWGAGENIVSAAADFEHFLEPRVELGPAMEDELAAALRLLLSSNVPFRLHATYGESIERFMNVIERVNVELDRPLAPGKTRFVIDHAETIRPREIDRIKALGGGVAIQHRLIYQGEWFRDRYGPEVLAESPPVRRMLGAGVPVGGGTDATRVAGHNPWLSLHWLVTGRGLSGIQMYGSSNRLSRMEALRTWTKGSAWFSGEEAAKGAIATGELADFAILSKPYLDVPEDEIRSIESLCTVVAGRVVYGVNDGAARFAELAPPPLPVSPSWSPVGEFGGYQNNGVGAAPPIAAGVAGAVKLAAGHHCAHGHAAHGPLGHDSLTGGMCSCAVF